MHGNGVVQTQYPVIGSDYKSEIDIRFHLINAKHKNNADLKFILQNLISEGLIESTEGGLLERRYRLTPKGYTAIKSSKFNINKTLKLILSAATLLAALLGAIWYFVDLYIRIMK